MATQVSFGRRLLAVLLPTFSQALACLAIALALLLGAQAQRALALIGIDDAALNVARLALHGRFETVLSSPISESAALVTFWAGIGVVAYLICWSAFNLIIQARNEITLNTQYTNRGHWQGPFQTLGLKSLAAAILIANVSLLKPGLALWLAIVASLLAAPNLVHTLYALAATLGLATQLYLILAFALVTFTPWYRAEAFTDQEK